MEKIILALSFLLVGLVGFPVNAQDKSCLDRTIKLSVTQKFECFQQAYANSRLDRKLKSSYLNLLLESASTGHIDSVYWLGKLYSEGSWVRASLSEANKLLIVSASDGHVDSQVLLALNYQRQANLAKSPTSLVLDARQWLERAAQSGNIVAKREFANHLLKYSQSISDVTKAQLLLQESARKGDKLAVERLVEFYGERYRETENERYLTLQKEWQAKISR